MITNTLFKIAYFGRDLNLEGFEKKSSYPGLFFDLYTFDSTENNANYIIYRIRGVNVSEVIELREKSNVAQLKYKNLFDNFFEGVFGKLPSVKTERFSLKKYKKSVDGIIKEHIKGSNSLILDYEGYYNEFDTPEPEELIKWYEENCQGLNVQPLIIGHKLEGFLTVNSVEKGFESLDERLRKEL